MMRAILCSIRIMCTTRRTDRGLSLVELLVALAVLLLALPGIFMLFNFTSTAFSSGQSQMDLQQNLRMVAEYVVEEARYADELIIIEEEDVESDVNARDEYDYVWIDDDNRFVHNEAPQFESISERIDLELQFSVDSDEDPRLLRIVVIGHRDDGRSVTYESEVRLLNMSIDGSPSGVAIEYLKPAPPFMVLESLNFLHEDPGNENEDDWSEYDFVRGHRYTNEETRVFVLLQTRNAPDGPEARIETVSGPIEYHDENVDNVNVHPYQGAQAIEEDMAFMKFRFPGGEPSGTYEVRCRVTQDTEWSATISALYRIYPLLSGMRASGSEDCLLGEYQGQDYDARIDIVVEVDDDSGDLTLDLEVFDANETIEFREGESGEFTEVGQPQDTEYSIDISEESVTSVVRLNASDGTVYTDYYITITRK